MPAPSLSRTSIPFLDETESYHRESLQVELHRHSLPSRQSHVDHVCLSSSTDHDLNSPVRSSVVSPVPSPPRNLEVELGRSERLPVPRTFRDSHPRSPRTPFVMKSLAFIGSRKNPSSSSSLLLPFTPLPNSTFTSLDWISKEGMHGNSPGGIQTWISSIGVPSKRCWTIRIMSRARIDQSRVLTQTCDQIEELVGDRDSYPLPPSPTTTTAAAIVVPNNTRTLSEPHPHSHVWQHNNPFLTTTKQHATSFLLDTPNVNPVNPQVSCRNRHHVPSL